MERQRAAGTEDQKPDTVLSKDIKVVADKSTNSLVVTARPDEFEALSNIVAKLDVVRKQVFIEALIMEVSSERPSPSASTGPSEATPGTPPSSVGSV